MRMRARSGMHVWCGFVSRMISKRSVESPAQDSRAASSRLWKSVGRPVHDRRQRSANSGAEPMTREMLAADSLSSAHHSVDHPVFCLGPPPAGLVLWSRGLAVSDVIRRDARLSNRERGCVRDVSQSRDRATDAQRREQSCRLALGPPIPVIHAVKRHPEVRAVASPGCSWARHCHVTAPASQ